VFVLGNPRAVMVLRQYSITEETVRALDQVQFLSSKEKEKQKKKKEFSIYPRSPEITKRANLTWIKQERVSEAFSTCIWN
jgi:hypothetical protein